MHFIPSVSSATACRRVALAGLVGASLLLGGCATYLGTQVTAYHQPDISQQGLSFRFKPDASQAGSLEYHAYAGLVREQLLKHGMVEAPKGGKPDVGVELKYSVGDGHLVNFEQPEYGYVYRGSQMVRRDRVMPDGGVTSYWEAQPIYGYDVIGYSSYQRLYYTHQLKLNIRRTQAREGELAQLYEGTAVAESQDGARNNIVPLLVQAIFQDFPGPSGVTRAVRVEIDDKKADDGKGKAAGSDKGEKAPAAKAENAPTAKAASDGGAGKTQGQ